jgi:mycothiol system anti-sigma-R factor
MSDEIDCEGVVRDLYTFLDGELTDVMRQRIRTHLDDCSPCLEAFDFEAEFRQIISARCREDPPEHLRLRITSALRTEFDLPGGGIAPGSTPFPSS